MGFQSIARQANPVLGVKFMDTDHNDLFAASDRLLATLSDKAAIIEVNEAFVALATLTLTHFDREERSMLESGYPDYSPHKAEHARLIEQISSIADRIKVENGGMVGDDLMVFLRDWLVTHIEGFDKAYARYLREVGAVSPDP